MCLNQVINEKIDGQLTHPPSQYRSYRLNLHTSWEQDLENGWKFISNKQYFSKVYGSYIFRKRYHKDYIWIQDVKNYLQFKKTNKTYNKHKWLKWLNTYTQPNIIKTRNYRLKVLQVQQQYNYQHKFLQQRLVNSNMIIDNSEQEKKECDKESIKFEDYSDMEIEYENTNDNSEQEKKKCDKESIEFEDDSEIEYE